MRMTAGRGLTEATVNHSNQIKNHLAVTADPDCEFVKEHFITPPFCGLKKKQREADGLSKPAGENKKEKSRSGLLLRKKKKV